MNAPTRNNCPIFHRCPVLSAGSSLIEWESMNRTLPHPFRGLIAGRVGRHGFFSSCCHPESSEGSTTGFASYRARSIAPFQMRCGSPNPGGGRARSIVACAVANHCAIAARQLLAVALETASDVTRAARTLGKREAHGRGERALPKRTARPAFSLKGVHPNGGQEERSPLNKPSLCLMPNISRPKSADYFRKISTLELVWEFIRNNSNRGPRRGQYRLSHRRRSL